jgi:hypothetical protein
MIYVVNTGGALACATRTLAVVASRAAIAGER